MGSELTVMLDSSGSVLVSHGGVDLGRIPSSVDWVSQHIADGQKPRCIVKTIELGGIIRQRATRVEVEIVPVDRALFEVAAHYVVESGASIARFAAGGVRLAGDAFTDVGDLAKRGADGIVTYGIVKPAAAVGQGLSTAADMTIARPVRAARRFVRNVFLAAVSILVLILLIVVVWRLPVIPTFNYGTPQPVHQR